MVATSSHHSAKPKVTASTLLSKKDAEKLPRKKTACYRAKKPKDMPRRPLSAYNIFFKEERTRLLAAKSKQQAEGKEVDNVSFASMAKTIGKRWKQLDDKELLRFKELAKGDLSRYRQEMADYNKEWASKHRQERKKDSGLQQESSFNSQYQSPKQVEDNDAFSNNNMEIISRNLGFRGLAQQGSIAQQEQHTREQNLLATHLLGLQQLGTQQVIDQRLANSSQFMNNYVARQPQMMNSQLTSNDLAVLSSQLPVNQLVDVLSQLRQSPSQQNTSQLQGSPAHTALHSAYQNTHTLTEIQSLSQGCPNIQVTALQQLCQILSNGQNSAAAQLHQSLHNGSLLFPANVIKPLSANV